MTAQDLKNSILQLAMQGKLVEQRAEEGTARELFVQIRMEKVQCVKEKTLPEITEDEIPYEVPQSWEWVRLANVCIYLQRGKSPKYSDIKKIPVIAQKCNQWDDFQLEKAQFIVPETLEKYPKERLLQDKDVLINSTGLGTVGRNQIYPEKDNPYGIAVADSHVTVVRLDSRILTPEFFFYYWRNPSVQLVIENQTSGSTKQKELALTTIQNYLVPIPPLAEQKRIVAKIEEVFPYIDHYDKAYTKLNIFNQKFSEDMQKSIMQYALQGKLVDQRPEEGTGEELYRRIQAEKEMLIKEGKIKAEKRLPEILDEEMPYKVPQGWCWVRLGELGTYKKGPFGSALTKSLFVPKGSNSVKVYEQKNAIKKDEKIGEYYITKDYFESKMRGFEVLAGDIIVSCAGTIGETYIMPPDCEQGIINQALMRIRLMPSVNVQYFLLYFDFILKDIARKSSKGSAIKNIPPFEKLKNYLVAFPPYGEQERIVKRLSSIVPYIQKIDRKEG